MRTINFYQVSDEEWNRVQSCSRQCSVFLILATASWILTGLCAWWLIQYGPDLDVKWLGMAFNVLAIPFTGAAYSKSRERAKCWEFIKRTSIPAEEIQ